MNPLHQRALETFKTQMSPLAAYIEDPAVQEIMVNSHSDIWIEKAGVMQKIEGLEIEDLRVRAAIKALASANDRNSVTSIMDARMPGYRIAAALYPVAVRGNALCIRKHNASSKLLYDYVESGALQPACRQEENAEHAPTASVEDYLSRHGDDVRKGGAALYEFLRWCIQARLNFIVAGATGSGKTTLMNALLGEIPPEDRVLTLEDTAELKVRVPNYVGLEANPSENIDIRALVRLSLRFRPDRIVVGEVRGPEAYDLIDAMNTGHSGGGCTLHADNALFALYRMENMVRMSPNAHNLPLMALRSLIAQTFRLVIFCSRLGGIRRPVEVALVDGIGDDGGYRTRAVYLA
jgi:pilus assembly protein CpaF